MKEQDWIRKVVLEEAQKSGLQVLRNWVRKAESDLKVARDEMATVSSTLTEYLSRVSLRAPKGAKQSPKSSEDCFGRFAPSQ